MPDMTAGYFDRFRNHRIFYGAEDKINQRLPSLATEFMKRHELTLRAVARELQIRHHR